MAHTTHPVHHAPDILGGRPSSSRRSARTLLTWAAILAAVVAAIVLAVLATTSDTGSQPNNTVPAPVAPAQPGVPLSPDQAERYLADQE
jgi:hypothetical protein